MSWRRRISSPLTPLVSTAAVLAVAVGALSGYEPRLGFLMAIGIAFVVLVFMDLLVGFAAMVMFAYLEVLSALEGLNLAKVAGALIVLAWLGVVSTRGGRARNFMAQRPGLAFLLLAFIAWNTISLAWAQDSSEALSSVMRYALNAILIPIAFTAIRDRRDLVRILAVIVFGASIAAVSAILSPPEAESAIAGRAAGTVGDPNELAAALVVGLALATAFMANRHISRPLRGLSAISAGLCLLGILISLSRGGLLGLGGALIVAVILGGKWRGKVIAVCVTLAAVAVGYFAFAASLPAQERVLNVGSGGGTGRLDLWTVGFRMVEAHPFIGVGTGQFPIVSVHYLLRPGLIERGDLILSTPKVAHNTYLNIVAEIGIVGGVLFGLILLFCVGCTFRAMKQFHSDGDERLEILLRGLLAGVGGYFVTLIFISENYAKLLWIVFALGPVMLAVARTPSAEEEQTQPARGDLLPLPYPLRRSTVGPSP